MGGVEDMDETGGVAGGEEGTVRTEGWGVGEIGEAGGKGRVRFRGDG